jgi:hypothetical protein
MSGAMVTADMMIPTITRASQHRNIDPYFLEVEFDPARAQLPYFWGTLGIG